MLPMRRKWLESDADASLTVKSMKLFDDHIKFGGQSVEQGLIARHVNHLLWDDLHDLKQHIFNIPVSSQIASEILSPQDCGSPARSQGSDGPTRNGTFADSKISSKLEHFDSR
jgi:hypothetical protein